MSKSYRMLSWVVLTAVLLAASLFAQSAWPGNVVSVSLYKAHLMALGGWGGYWLDRALFPYARPDMFLAGSSTDRTANVFSSSQLRRAIIVAACLICVGLGA
jgi:Putative 2/3 transmembrane domain holin